MKIFDSLIEQQNALAKECIIYNLLDKFGDRLPKDIQEEMIEEAKFQRTLYKTKKKQTIFLAKG